MKIMWNGSFSEGAKNANESYKNASYQWNEGSKENGPTISGVRAAGWIAKGALWDSTIAPLGKTTIGGLGYIFNGLVAYPAMLATEQAYNTTLLAVEYTQMQVMNGYDYVAPFGEAAMAGILTSAKYVGGHTASGIVGTASKTTKVTGAVLSGVTTTAASTGLFAAEKTVRYIGVPLAIGGTTVARATTGAFVAVGGVATGLVTKGGSEVAAYTTEGAMKTAAGATFVGGTVASTAAGAVVGVYQVGQALVVPPSMMLGSGLVITYGGLTQLAGQSVLAAADAAYCVLSLEGPKYVIYSVKGLVNPKSELPAGTVIDLQELRKRGEVIKKMPLTDEEVDAVVKKTLEELPQKQEFH